MTILALRRFGLMTLLAVAFVAAAVSSAMASERRAPSIDWQGCGGDHPAAECATVRVPLDYNGPSQATTPLALARFPATDPEHRIGTIFVNPGGPGGSGVELVLDGFGEALRDNLGGRFDVVGFDPRGIGASDPHPLLRQRGGPRRVPVRRAAVPLRAGPVPAVLRPLRFARRSLPEPGPGNRKAHEHGRRRARPRPAPAGGRRQAPDLPRVLLRDLHRHDLREPLPGQRPRAGHRRRARPPAVVVGLADPLGSCGDPGGVRRVPAAVPTGRAGVRVRGRRADGPALGDARSRGRARADRPR